MYKKIVLKIEDLDTALNVCKKTYTDGAYILTFQPLRQKRRDAQNRRYWAILHQIAEQLKINGNVLIAETWHECAKRRFIGVIEIPLPDGEIIVVGMSSTELDIPEFNDFMMMVEAWAIDQNVIFNDLPNE